MICDGLQCFAQLVSCSVRCKCLQRHGSISFYAQRRVAARHGVMGLSALDVQPQQNSISTHAIQSALLAINMTSSCQRIALLHSLPATMHRHDVHFKLPRQLTAQAHIMTFYRVSLNGGIDTHIGAIIRTIHGYVIFRITNCLLIRISTVNLSVMLSS